MTYFNQRRDVDRRKVVTEEQERAIARMFDEGKKPGEIYRELLAKHSYTGSRSTIDNKLEVLRARKEASADKEKSGSGPLPPGERKP
jgi:hypothetical protein